MSRRPSQIQKNCLLVGAVKEVVVENDALANLVLSASFNSMFNSDRARLDFGITKHEI